MAMFGLPGGMEWVFILGIVLLLFGPSQLPKLAKTFGKSAKALKDGLATGMDEDEDEKPKESAKAEKTEDGDA